MDSDPKPRTKEKFGPAEPSLETQAALEFLGRQAPIMVASIAPYLPVEGKPEVAQKVLFKAWSKTGLAKALRASPGTLAKSIMDAADEWMAENRRSWKRAAKRGLKYVERAPKLSEHVLSPEDVLVLNAELQAVEDAINTMPKKRRAAYLTSRKIKDHSKAAATCGFSIAAYKKHLVRANQDIARAVAPFAEEYMYA